ncbi:MAG: biotin synthase BioB [Desulfobacterales bacterium]|nr:biotin synthase BioB [Desulfobacterales bacterium]
MFNDYIVNITKKILKGDKTRLTYEAACEMALLPEKNTPDLITCAQKIRQKFKGNKIFTCSIINAKSGLCSQDCAFCAQSSHHDTGLQTYPLMEKAEMVTRAEAMHKAGATNFSIVTSGYKLSEKDLDTICSTTSEIKEKYGMTICASVGMVDMKMAKRLTDSGVTNYHHNLETSRSHFDKICTTHEYDEDIDALHAAADGGMNVCSGGIMGLGETWVQRVELAFILKELDVPSIPLNFLNPIPGTRFENMPKLSPMDALKCIALFRMINPDKDITICGGREVTLKEYQSWVFPAGANGLMVGNYLTTKGRRIEIDMEMIKDMGLENVND